MIKIKVIWKDSSESYVISPNFYTQFIDKAKDYHSILIAARTARKIKNSGDFLVKDVVIVTDTKTYNVFQGGLLP